MSSSGSIPPRDGLIIAEAYPALLWIPSFFKDGARLFTVGVTRARQRVYVIAARGTLVRDVRSDSLFGPPAAESTGPNPLQQEVLEAF